MAQIIELRRLVSEAEILTDVSKVYHQLVLEPAFLERSEFAAHDVLLATVRGVVKLAFEVGSPARSALKRVVGHPLWHGMFIYPCGLMVEFVYFDDLTTCVAHTTDMSGGRQRQFRFSVNEASTPKNAESMKLVGVTVRRNRGLG